MYIMFCYTSEIYILDIFAILDGAGGTQPSSAPSPFDATQKPPLPM